MWKKNQNKSLEEIQAESSIPWAIGMGVGILALYVLILGGILAAFKSFTDSANQTDTTETIQLP